MNWLALALVGTVAAWFEYNYRRSRHHESAKKPSSGGPQPAQTSSIPDSVADAEPDQERPKAAVPGDGQRRNASA